MKSIKERIIGIIQIILSIIACLSGLLNIISAIIDVDNIIITVLSLLWMLFIWVIVILEFIKNIYKPSEEPDTVPYERIVLVSLIISIIGLFTLILNGIVTEVGNEIAKTANIIAILVVPSVAHFLSIYCCVFTKPYSKYGTMNRVSFGLSTVAFAFTVMLFFRLVLVDLLKIDANIAIIPVLPLMILSAILSILLYKKRLNKGK